MPASSSLPEHLLVVYNRYKHDTEIIAGWLAKNSAIAGWKPSDNSEGSDKVPKLKGRARKLARDAAKAGSQKGYEYVVKPTDFIGMAQAIVTTKPTTSLSEWMQKVFTRTINARRKCTNWFKAQSNKTSASDDKHLYFANVLQKTLDILKPCWQIAVPSPVQNPETSTSDGDHNNRFKKLKLEETLSQEYMEQAEDQQQACEKKDNIVAARLVLDESEIESEFIFAIWTFLDELSGIRVMLEATWMQYLAGNMELMQAGLITNTAIDLVRRAEAEFEVSLKRPTKYPASRYPTGSLLMLVFHDHLRKVLDRPFEFDPTTQDVIVICGCSVCRFTMYVPYVMTKMYMVRLKGHDHSKTVKDEQHVSLPDFETTGSLSSQENYFDSANPSQVAQTRMLSALPDLISTALLHKQLFFEDEIVHAARHVYERRTVPFWVSFAFSIHLDVSDLREMFGRSPLKDLQTAVHEAKARHAVHCDWIRTARPSILPSSEENYKSLITEFEDWTVNGRYGLMRDNEKLGVFFLTCATMKLQLFLEVNLIGRSLMNYSDHVLMMAHLYCALRIHDPSLPRWPDMELFIAMQGPEYIFVGGLPTTMAEAKSKVLLAYGASAGSFAKDRHRRQQKGRKIRSERRRVVRVTAITENLSERITGAETRKVDECAHGLQELLISSKYTESISRLMWQDKQTKGKSVSELIIDMSAGAGEGSAACSAAYNTFRGLSLAFSVEAPAFALDYLSLHRRCWEVFKQISIGFVTTLEDTTAISTKSQSVSGPDNAFGLTIQIIGSVVESESFNEHLRKSKKLSVPGGPGSSRSFQSMTSSNATAEYKEKSAEVARKIETQGVAAVAAELFIIEKGHAATHILQPVDAAIRSLYKKGEGDIELKKLKKLQSQSTYGQYVFSNNALKSLFGPDREKEWEMLLSTSSDKTHFIVDQNLFSHESMVKLLVCKQLICELRVANRKAGSKLPPIFDITAEQSETLERFKALEFKFAGNTSQRDTEDGLGGWFG